MNKPSVESTSPQNPAATTSSLWTRVLQRPLLICLLLAGMTAAVYWPVKDFEFINYDDQDYFSENYHVLAGLSWPGVKWAFTTGHASNWHPLTWLSHMLDAELFGSGPRAPHLINLVFHIANAIILFLFLRKVTGAQWRCALVAGLFALHPLHVESVAWISERKDVLSTFFGFISLWCYGTYAQKQSKPKTLYAIALFSFALSLLSKPMFVTLPFLLLLLDVWPLQRLQVAVADFRVPVFRPLVIEKIPFFLLSALSCIATFVAQQMGGAVKSLESMSAPARLENALVSYARYLGKTFWPTDMAIPYPYPGSWPPAAVILAAVLIVGLCTAAVMIGKKRPYVFSGWFWFFGTLVPVIGLVQVGAQSMADRYAYVPIVGIFIIVAWGAGDLTTRWQRLKPAFAVGAILLLGSCCVRTADQLSHWQNSGALASHAIAVTMNNDIAHSNLGNYYLENGRLDEAIDQYRKVLLMMWSGGTAPADPVAALTGNGTEQERQQLLRADPKKLSACVEILNNLGTALAQRGRSDDSIALYQLALRIKPDHALALHNLGFEFAAREDYDQAIPLYEAAIRARPDRPQLHNSLGEALVKVGRYEDAIRHYERARQLAPKDAKMYYNLGLVYVAEGDPLAAIPCFEIALTLDSKLIEVHNNLGSALMSTGKIDEAIRHFRLLLEQMPGHARAHDNLGVAMATSGNLDDAINHFRESLRFEPNNATTYFNLGNVLAQQRRLDKAVIAFSEAIRLNTRLAKAHCHMAGVLAELGRREEAASHLEQALRIDPAYEQARAMLQALTQSP